jgi:hypothetical protein
MITTALETRVLAVLVMCRGQLPDEQVDDMEEDVRAGEAGIALENLATQLYEYDVPVEQQIIDEIAALGNAMKLDPKYWTRLTSKS